MKQPDPDPVLTSLMFAAFIFLMMLFIREFILPVSEVEQLPIWFITLVTSIIFVVFLCGVRHEARYQQNRHRKHITRTYQDLTSEADQQAFVQTQISKVLDWNEAAQLQMILTDMGISLSEEQLAQLHPSGLKT